MLRMNGDGNNKKIVDGVKVVDRDDVDDDKIETLHPRIYGHTKVDEV